MAARDGALPAPPAVDAEELAAGETALPHAHPRRAALRRFLAHRMAVLSLLVLLVLIAVAVCANLLPLIDPTDGDAYGQDSLPSRLHLLGTDDAGHDLLSALIFGLRHALAAGILGQAVCTMLGLALGLLAAYHGGWVDGLLSRLTDLLFAIPPSSLLFWRSPCSAQAGRISSPGPGARS
jgi:peptide/nickel transport system permease protein